MRTRRFLWSRCGPSHARLPKRVMTNNELDDMVNRGRDARGNNWLGRAKKDTLLGCLASIHLMGGLAASLYIYIGAGRGQVILQCHRGGRVVHGLVERAGRARSREKSMEESRRSQLLLDVKSRHWRSPWERDHGSLGLKQLLLVSPVMLQEDTAQGSPFSLSFSY